MIPITQPSGSELEEQPDSTNHTQEYQCFFCRNLDNHEF